MKTNIPLGIYYLDYSERDYPRAARKLIIGYTKDQFLKSIEETNVPPEWKCWLEECRTTGYLAEGTIEDIKEWILFHMPDKFGEPLK